MFDPSPFPKHLRPLPVDPDYAAYILEMARIERDRKLLIKGLVVGFALTLAAALVWIDPILRWFGVS